MLTMAHDLNTERAVDAFRALLGDDFNTMDGPRLLRLLSLAQVALGGIHARLLRLEQLPAQLSVHSLASEVSTDGDRWKSRALLAEQELLHALDELRRYREHDLLLAQPHPQQRR